MKYHSQCLKQSGLLGNSGVIHFFYIGFLYYWKGSALWPYIHSQCLHYGSMIWQNLSQPDVDFRSSILLTEKEKVIWSHIDASCALQALRDIRLLENMMPNQECPYHVKKKHTSPWTSHLFLYKWDKTEYFLSEREIVTDGPCQCTSSTKNVKWFNHRTAYCKSGEVSQCAEH